MQQIIHKFEGKEYVFPNDATPDEIRAELEKVMPKSLFEKIIAYLPSGRDAARMTGGMIGGALGFAGGTVAGTPIAGVPGAALGGAAGASIGESLYQLGSGEVAEQSPQEAATKQTGALIQGTTQEAIPAFISSRIPPFLKSGASRNVAQVLGPSSKGEKEAVGKITDDLVDDIPFGATSDELLTKFKVKLDKAGSKLEDVYNQLPQAMGIRTTPVRDALVKSRDSLKIKGQYPPGTAAQVSAYDELIEWFNANPSMKITELRKNKQLWDKLVNYWRGGLAKEPIKESVYAEGANNLRQLMHNIFPELERANRQVHIWKTGTDVLGESATKEIGRMSVLLPTFRSGALGGAVGYSLGGPAGAGIGSTVALLTSELTQTTAWKTASILARRNAIKLLNNGNIQGAIKALTAVGAGGAVKAGEKISLKEKP